MNIDQLKAEIIDKRIKIIYRGKKPIDTFDFEGLGTLHTYRFIMELDNGKKYAFNRDYIWKWDNAQAITAIDSELKSHYENTRIADITVVDEDCYFLLENKMVLYHNQDFGSQLCCEEYHSLFNEKGEMI